MIKAALVAVVSDTHFNDTVALCPPITSLDDGGAYQPSKVQSALWGSWLDFWSIVWKAKRRLGVPVYAIHLGDLLDRNEHSSAQLITTNRASILSLARKGLEPMVDVADKIFFIRGTGAHTGDCGELEEIAADYTEKTVSSEHAGTASWWVLSAEIGGVFLEATHHPPAGSKQPDGRNAAACRAAALDEDRAVSAGRVIPDLFLFGHAHYPAVGKGKRAWAYQCPAWKAAGAYGYRIGLGAHVDPAGGLLFLMKDGRFNKDAFVLYHPRREPLWTAS